MDISLVMTALRNFNDAEPPTTKAEAKKLVAAVMETGIDDLQGWVEELTDLVYAASTSIDELAEADSDTREGCFESATNDVFGVLDSLNAIVTIQLDSNA